jgi:hypothetical protein
MGGSSARLPTAQRAYRARVRGSSRCFPRSSHSESETQALTPLHRPRNRTQPLTQEREAHPRPGSPRDRPSLAPALADGIACLARTRAPNDRPLIASIKLRGNPQFSVNALRGGDHMAESTSPDLPLESSIPAASLDSILCTEELRSRPWRPPDYEKENGALVALLSALLHSSLWWKSAYSCRSTSEVKQSGRYGRSCTMIAASSTQKMTGS